MESLHEMEKKDGGIVPARNDEETSQEQDKWGIMDVLDEELIRADLAGTDIDDLVYSFKIGDKLIEDLTSQGAIAMARLAVQTMPVSILCDKPITEERPNSWKASTKCAYVTERGNRFEFWGTFVQSKDIYNKKGEFIRHDDKAEQISEVKSTRNVILKIFPKTARVTFIKQFKSEGQIKEIPAEKVKEAAAQAKVVGSGTAKSSSQPEKKENQAQQQLLALPGYERKTRLAEIAEDRIEDMRRAVADISWYYSKSGDYKNNAAFKAGNPWGWARKDSQAAEGLVASLDEEGPDSKIIFDDEEYWFDETAEKIWRKKI